MATTTTPVPPSEAIQLENVWRSIKNETMLNQMCPLNNSDAACDMYESCISRLTILYKEIDIITKSQKFHFKFGPTTETTLFSLNNALYMGLIMGAFVGGALVYVLTMIAERCKEKKNLQFSDRNDAIQSM